MSLFDWILTASAVVMGVSVVFSLVQILISKEELSKAVLSDAVFYGSLGVYLTWTIMHPTHIDYDIAIIAATLAGVLPTISLSRVISRGRR